jgi:hypothetical protein
MQMMQQGNLAAQNYLMGGMPSFQASLMGGPMNYGRQFNPQPFQMQMPQMPQAQFPFQGQPQQPQPQQMPFNPLGGM